MFLKRIFDIICSMLGLIILSPLFIAIGCIIKLSSQGPVFFTQARVGKDRKIFFIHKFRTMVVNAEKLGLKITVGDDLRVNGIGKWLRKTKLDELPQLIDVLIGNMSLVGPRPEVPEYVRYYSDEAAAIIFQVRPGITDWASLKMIDENKILAVKENPQEAYINEILPQKLAYATNYVKTRSFLGDIYLILLTIIKIVSR